MRASVLKKLTRDFICETSFTVKIAFSVYIMPAEQFKSTLTRACWCKLLNCSGARFFAILRKTLHFKKESHFDSFKIRRQSMDTDGQNKILTHKIEILTRFYIIAFANAIIQ